MDMMLRTDDMATPAVHPRAPTAATPAAARPRGLVARLVDRVLRAVAHGRLTIVLPGGARVDHQGPHPGPHGTVVILHPRALWRILTGGDVGFAEAVIAGEIDSPDMPALIRLAAENMADVDRALSGLWIVRLWRRIGHALRRNSGTGSRRNIAFHYDLGNDFYRLWLDDSMTYSSALALPPGGDLAAAQAAKLDRIVHLAGIGGGERVLEIGCGWGALARRLAAAGAAVTGITLSREQLAWAAAAVAADGLADRVALRLEDYRATQGSFDRIVSIEMIEAVGVAWWPAYFRQIHDRLRPGGRAVIQAITIAENRFEDYRRRPDFIQRYIFPGGMLPTKTLMASQTAAAGLTLAHVEHFGSGYADTLAAWRRRFDAAEADVAALGYDARFRRMWRYYLDYCEGGFRAGGIDVGLYVLERPA